MGEVRACVCADAATRNKDLLGVDYTSCIPFTIEEVTYKITVRKRGQIKTLLPVFEMSIHYIGRVYTRGSTWWAKPLQNETDYSYEADSIWDPSIQLGAWKFRRKFIQIAGNKVTVTTSDATDPPMNCRYTFKNVTVECHQGVDFDPNSGTYRWRLGQWNNARINDYNAPYVYVNGVPVTVGGYVTDTSPVSLLACGVVTVNNLPLSDGANEAPAGPTKVLELIFTSQNARERQEVVSLKNFNSVLHVYKATETLHPREEGKYYSYRNLPEFTAPAQFDIADYDFHITGLYPIFPSHVANTSELYGFGTYIKEPPLDPWEDDTMLRRFIFSADKVENNNEATAVSVPPVLTGALLIGVNKKGERAYLTGVEGTLKDNAGKEVFSRPKVEGGTVSFSVVLCQHETRTYVAYATVEKPNKFPVIQFEQSGSCIPQHTIYYSLCTEHDETTGGCIAWVSMTDGPYEDLEEAQAAQLALTGDPNYIVGEIQTTYIGSVFGATTFYSFSREIYLCVRSGDAVKYELLSDCKGTDGYSSATYDCATTVSTPTTPIPKKDPGVYSIVSPAPVGPYSSTFVGATNTPTPQTYFDHAEWYDLFQENDSPYKADTVVAQPQCACSKDGERIIVQQFFHGVSGGEFNQNTQEYDNTVKPTAHVKSFSRLYISNGSSLEHYDIATPREQIYGLKKKDNTNAQGGTDDGAEVDEVMRSIYVP